MLRTQKTVEVLLRGLDLLARELILGGLTKKQLSDADKSPVIFPIIRR
jgi:hypothetical protein